jgi:thiol-disulfide isomerase/thioredoxin
MNRLSRLRALFCGLALCLAIPLSAQQSQWLTRGEGGVSRVHLYFFWSSTCPHCREALPVIETMAREHPWLVLHSGNIVNDREQLKRYQALAVSLGQEARSVPAFFVCGRMLVGWDAAGEMGRILLRSAEQCREDGIAAAHEPLPALPGGMEAADYSLPLFTLIIAALDAFNPCAFFVLLFLLSLLVNARDRLRMLLVGGTFVVISGALYFLFMAAWLNLFLLIGSLGWINMAAGLVAVVIGLFGIKDFWFALRGPSLSIPASAKPKLYGRVRGLLSADRLPVLLSGTVLLAIVANSYELLCTAGFPMIYTRTLTLHRLDSVEYYLYLLLYNFIYIVPLALIVAAFVITLGGRKLSLNEGRLLKLLSGLMMFGLGLVLLLKPDLLNDPWAGIGLLASALIVTLIARGWLKGRAATRR